MITINLIKQSINESVVAREADTRFLGDYEIIEFSAGDYDSLHLVDTDHSGDTLYEKVVAIIDNDFYLLTAKTSSYNGEKQVTFTRQQLSLNGFNYFTKDIEEDFEGVYNKYLQSQGYDITLEDIKTLGEYKPELANCTILQFKDEEDNKHYLTVNQHGQLSKITKKLSGKQVKTKTTKSAFGF